MNMLDALALARLRQWSAERRALNSGRIARYTSRPGRPPAHPVTNRYDAALVRCIDFEREFSKLPTDTQTILLLVYREKQPQQVVAQITGWSLRKLSYMLPTALSQLARLLDKADLL